METASGGLVADTMHIMVSTAPPLLAVVLGALLGAVLGRWPLAAWAMANLTDERRPERGIRLASCLATAATFAVIAGRFADASGWAVLPALLVFAAASTVLAIVDLVEKRLPNAVIAPALIAIAVLLVIAAALTGEWLRLAWVLAGGAGMFAVYLVLALISPRSMGMGDVKLAALIGALLGWFGLSCWLVGLVAAFIVGGVVALVALALRRVTLRGSIPFGPSMLVGAMVALVLAG